ncbi:hypothetical protein CPLU01_01607 [Colletotrichum plurivorum]|uniref:Uncharacterized protein n=1 Tax=Colletotrichum plurivorum TaxID=2175906 RepID=A0A8H6NNR2_9PEZI|nr:hypothetical protein CPLU01_01607 [Colletotrichum plurivorum]
MGISSTLTDMSAVSSPASFRTAIQSPEVITAVSMAGIDPPAPSYSSASELPRELKEHCQIYLEEHLYNGALGLLNSLLTAGHSRRDARKKPVGVPPATHLALLNTIVIHPSHTTRAAGPDRLEVGSQTLDYLRNLLAIVGPINAGFKTAFRFHGAQYGRRSRYDDDEDEIDGDQINNKMAGEDSIWHRAHSLWSVVGWAFNCTRVHPHRWRFWKTWLEYMLDVLEADFKQRKRMDQEASNSSQTPEWTNLRESMIVEYIKQTTDSNSSGLSLIRQAIFADGSAQSLRRFPEIFHKETKGLPNDDKKRKRMATLDIENDQFGDYFNDDPVESDSDNDSSPGTPTEHTPRKRTGELVTASTAESIPLRMRLMDLLSEVAERLPGDFQEHNKYTSELCRLLRQQPLAFFQQFVPEMGAQIGDAFEVDILTTLLDQLLPDAYLDPETVSSAPDSPGCIVVNAEVLTACYLPWHANTIEAEDNAQVAIILETMLHQLSPEEIKGAKDKLRNAALQGNEARKWKTSGLSRRGKTTPRAASSKKGSNQKDDFAREVIELTGERIVIYIDAMSAISESEDEDDEDEEMMD